MKARTTARGESGESSLRFLDATAEAAFAADEKRRIVVWNRAAELLTGHDAARVIGKPCYEVVQGKDLSGNRFCSESCSLRKMTRRHEPIHAFQFQVSTASGRKLRVECTIIVVPGPRPGGHSLIHLLHPANRTAEGQHSAGAGPESAEAPGSAPEKKPPAGCPRPLTPREAEILRLVASGADTADIAVLLSISAVTVRNHIQHILYKLEAHNRLQAIFVARRHNMI